MNKYISLLIEEIKKGREGAKEVAYLCAFCIAVSVFLLLIIFQLITLHTAANIALFCCNAFAIIFYLWVAWKLIRITDRVTVKRYGVLGNFWSLLSLCSSPLLCFILGYMSLKRTIFVLILCLAAIEILWRLFWVIVLDDKK